MPWAADSRRQTDEWLTLLSIQRVRHNHNGLAGLEPLCDRVDEQLLRAALELGLADAHPRGAPLGVPPAAAPRERLAPFGRKKKAPFFGEEPIHEGISLGGG